MSHAETITNALIVIKTQIQVPKGSTAGVNECVLPESD